MIALVVFCIFMASGIICDECPWDAYAMQTMHLSRRCVNCIEHMEGESLTHFDCISCEEGYLLINKRDCKDLNNIMKCPIGTYSSSGWIEVGMSCTDCPTGKTTASQGSTECISECSVTKRPIKDLPGLYKGLTVFVDFPFQCEGRVSSVEFYARNVGKFYLSAWRPLTGGDAWSLVASIPVISEVEGEQTYIVPDAEVLQVEASDVLGIFYSQESRIKIIPTKNIRKNQRTGASSRYIRTRQNLEDLSEGVTMSTLVNNGRSERTMPLNVNISN